jgi:hypothetical protein
MSMPTIGAVTQALLRAGERRASRRTGGFRATGSGSGTVVVRWHAPERGGGLAFLEEYAALLRDAGICAVVATDGPEPRVLCLPGRVIGQRARRSPARMLDAG